MSTRCPAHVKSTAVMRRASLCQLEQQIAVPTHCHRAVRLAFDPLAPAPAHRVKVVLTVVRVADRPGEELRSAGWHDNPAPNPGDDLGRLTLGVRGRNH